MLTDKFIFYLKRQTFSKTLILMVKQKYFESNKNLKNIIKHCILFKGTKLMLTSKWINKLFIFLTRSFETILISKLPIFILLNFKNNVLLSHILWLVFKINFLRTSNLTQIVPVVNLMSLKKFWQLNVEFNIVKRKQTLRWLERFLQFKVRLLLFIAWMWFSKSNFYTIIIKTHLVYF